MAFLAVIGEFIAGLLLKWVGSREVISQAVPPGPSVETDLGMEAVSNKVQADQAKEAARAIDKAARARDAVDADSLRHDAQLRAPGDPDSRD